MHGFVTSFDSLAADWTLDRQRREAAEKADRAAFCEGAQSLFDEVKSRVLWRKTAVNFFKVSGRQRQEDAHSRTIGWLMDPDEAHGLQDKFLRAFFERAYGRPAPLGTLECKVTVKKGIESGEVDIKVAGPGWMLVVENKIDSEEGQGQTEKYAAYYKRFYKLRENLFLVFLSRSGKPAQSPDFTPMSYRDLRGVIESVHPPAPEAEIIVRDLIQNIRHLEV